MKRFVALLAGLAVFVLGASISSSQQSPSGSSQLLDTGAIIYLELSKTVDAKKAKPGDEVRATLLADVLSHGKIVLRQDSRLLGHITEVQAFSKDKPESRLGVAFDRIVGKGGQETAFHSVLLGISPAPRLQVTSMTGPRTAVPNPAGWAPQDRQNPLPRAAATPTPVDPVRSERESLSHGGGTPDMQPTDIDGLTLAPTTDGNQVVVSFRSNVKLESGVRLSLRVTSQGQAGKTQAP
jgi:hypothetical protein